MGVPKLWDEVKIKARRVNLTDYLNTHAIPKAGPNGLPSRLPRLGIDASVWMHQVSSALSKHRHVQLGENPELRTLYIRVGELYAMVVDCVFVFDGSLRSAEKRGKAVQVAGHWLTGRFKEFIVAFGFSIIEAPGEADAELANLNCAGIIDVVLTTDIDTLVFGATCVAKMLSHEHSTTAGKSKSYKSTLAEVEIYNAYEVASDPVNLTTGGLLLTALLMGGDYDTGVKGLGGAIAHALARAGYGDSLYNAFKTKTVADFVTFCIGWRADVINELKTNASRCLKRCEPKAATAIPPSFPDIEIIKLYVNPVVSPSNGIGNDMWVFRRADFQALVRLCEASFTWGNAAGIAKDFRKHVFPGMALRQLVEFDILGTSETIREDSLIQPSLYTIKQCAPIRGLRNSRRYILKVFIDQVQMTIGAHLRGLRPSEAIPNDISLHFIELQAPVFLVDPLGNLVKGKRPKIISKTAVAGTSSQANADYNISENDSESDATPPASILQPAHLKRKADHIEEGTAGPSKRTGLHSSV